MIVMELLSRLGVMKYLDKIKMSEEEMSKDYYTNKIQDFWI